MSAILWLMVSMLGMVIIIGAVFIWQLRKKNWEHQTDYRSFFWIGLAWTVFGLGYAILTGRHDVTFFLPMGVIFLAMGLANRDKWGKKQGLTPEQKRVKLIAVIAGFMVLALGIAAFILLL